MASRETSERLAGSAFLGVPAFDAFVWLLDNYGRWDLLVNLHDHLPRFLTSPLVTFACMCIGLWLLHRSHQEQLRRAYEEKTERRLVDTSGTEIINREKSRILIPVLVVFLIALLITPLAAVGFSLAYKGNPPKNPSTPRPPLFAYEKPKNTSREPQKNHQQSGNNDIQTGPITVSQPCSPVQVGHDNSATVNCVPPQRALTLSQQEAFVDALGPSPLSVSVYCYSTDKEGCTYAGSFFRAFKKAKWNTGVTVGMYFATPVDSEVYLTIQNQNERPQGFEEISRALTAVSVPLHGLIQSDLKPDEIRITVGRTLPD